MSWEDLIPRPSSKFLRVRCRGCQSEKMIFSHASRVVRCDNCGEVLAKPTGGKAEIHGVVVKELG
ncbi:MAG: 30S ribosomal protein S27ae [Candidatus Bathyarchaeota archaeon B23]|nr:MAG: 30S ribosomal protein S27ae [Candidatus Bathyarchaeota archaeon B23]